jgi:hypothetical protein
VWGGSYQGKGKYLSQIQVIPNKINVAWGYSLSAQTSIPTVLNMGTSDNPIAGAEIHLSYQVDTILKKQQFDWVFFAKGDGSFKLING